MKIKKEDKFLLLIVVVFLLLCINAFSLSKKEETNTEINKYNFISKFSFDKEKYEHVTLDIEDSGYDIYTPTSSTAYRYGPSIIKNEDGTYETLFASPGNLRDEWDYIRYRQSDDGSYWYNDKIVLKPTRYSEDCCSTCDPGLIYFNGYYYLGYTSTASRELDGYDNSVFVARSTSIDGPYEKWDGEGWGGNPQAIIKYEGEDKYWGYGEPSFVIKDNTLYIYYSAYVENGSLTYVATADLSEDWPASISSSQIAFNKIYGQDSCDVVYVEDVDMFISLSIGDRLNEGSFVCLFESDDGITFDYAERIYGIMPYAHSIGIAKDLRGHVTTGEDLLIGYAYGESWGKWSTRMHNVKFETYYGETREHD